MLENGKTYLTLAPVIKVMVMPMFVETIVDLISLIKSENS